MVVGSNHHSGIKTTTKLLFSVKTHYSIGKSVQLYRFNCEMYMILPIFTPMTPTTQNILAITLIMGLATREVLFLHDSLQLKKHVYPEWPVTNLCTKFCNTELAYSQSPCSMCELCSVVQQWLLLGFSGWWQTDHDLDDDGVRICGKNFI